MWQRTIILSLVSLFFAGCLEAENIVGSGEAAATETTASVVPLRHQRKHLAALQVSIKTPAEIPQRDSEELTLTGEIAILNNLDGPVTYTWEFPENVTVISGSASGTLEHSTLSSNPVSVTIKGFSKNRSSKIFLFADGKMGNSKVRASAIIVSNPEDTMEYKAHRMYKDSQEQLKKNPRDN